MEEMREMTYDEWRAEAERRFGKDSSAWRFACPSCGHVASVADYRAAGAPDTAIAFSCVGRWTGADGSKAFAGKGGPCNYAGGGFIGLNPVRVRDVDGKALRLFDFAPTAPAPEVVP